MPRRRWVTPARASALFALLLASLAPAAAPPVVRLDLPGDPPPTGAVAHLGDSRLRHLFPMSGYVAISPDGPRSPASPATSASGTAPPAGCSPASTWSSTTDGPSPSRPTAA